MKRFVAFIIIGCSLGVLWYFSYKSASNSSDENILVVGTNAEYPPFTYVENDTIIGFDIDLINEVAIRIGKKIIIKDMPFDVLIPEVQRGTISVIAAGLTPTPEKKKEVLFSECYFDGDPLVIISSGAKPLKTIESLTGKDVVVNEGYTADFYMSAIKGPVIKRFPAPAASFLALQSGRADAYVAARSTVKPFFKQYGTDQFSVAEIPGTEEKYALAISPRDGDLVGKINSVINEMQKDGTIEQLKNKWDLK